MRRSLALEVRILCAVLLLVGASACSRETPPATTPPPAGAADTPIPAAVGIEILEATFTRGLDEDGQPVDSVSEFAPDETVYLVLTFTGRPKGIVTSRFYRSDVFLGEADVDLADLSSGVVFSIGENTYVNFWMAADADAPSIISEAYRIEVFYDDEPVGDYPFRVVPPPGAVPSRVREVTLARGADANYNPIEPATTFAPDEEVYVVGRGDIGLYTRLQVAWYVNGQLDEAGSNSITAEENATDAGFYFSYVPDAGWPGGEHQVVLIVNGEEVGRYDFAIAAAKPISFEDPAGVFSLDYPADFDQIEEDMTEGYSYTFFASDGSGLVYVFFDVLDSPLSDDQWQDFAAAYTVAGMPGFGADTVELGRQLGQPGVHFLYLEVESEEENAHGLVWVEEAGGAVAVAVLAAPIGQWSARQPELSASLDSFIWSPEAVHAAIGGE